MIQYALKRLLLMPPTFFLISMVVFLLLNLAPGSPTETTGAHGEGGTSAGASESLRVFKEQFSLDKPILLNTRQWLTAVEVKRLLLATGAGSDAERLDAAEALDDGGNDLVPHFVVLLDDPEVQAVALLRLPQAAKLPYMPDHRGTADEVRLRNAVVEAHNAEVNAWRPANLGAAELVTRWKDWYPLHRAEYEYDGFGERVSDLVLDTRFARYWGNLLRLDFGRSVIDRQPITPKILSRVRYSLSLTLVSIVLAYLVAVPLGIFSAVKRESRADTVITVLLFMMYSLPTFFTGTVLLRWLSVGDPFAWFPTGGFETVDRVERTVLSQLLDVGWHLILPVFTYTSVTLAALSRYARAGVIEVIRSDYVRTARAKGLSEPVVILKHAARNGMIPILTLLGGLLPLLFGGSVVIEAVFGIPGLGQFLLESIGLRDYNAVMGVLLISSVLTLIGIFLSDLSYALVDPRISFD